MSTSFYSNESLSTLNLGPENRRSVYLILEEFPSLVQNKSTRKGNVSCRDRVLSKRTLRVTVTLPDTKGLEG